MINAILIGFAIIALALSARVALSPDGLTP